MAFFPRHHLKTFRTLAVCRSTRQSNRFYSVLWNNAHFHITSNLQATSSASSNDNNLTSKHPLLRQQNNGAALRLRAYSSSDETPRSLPTVMDFPNIVWPSVFKTIKNWIMINFIIRPYFDQEFSMPDFVSGSKQAVEVVSSRLGTLDMKSLGGLVASDAIDELRGTTSRMSMAQRNEIPINKDDIYLSFPYQVGIMFDETNDELQQRWVEITMVFHVLRGLQEMRDNGIVPPLNIG